MFTVLWIRSWQFSLHLKGHSCNRYLAWVINSDDNSALSSSWAFPTHHSLIVVLISHSSPSCPTKGKREVQSSFFNVSGKHWFLHGGSIWGLGSTLRCLWPWCTMSSEVSLETSEGSRQALLPSWRWGLGCSGIEILKNLHSARWPGLFGCCAGARPLSGRLSVLTVCTARSLIVERGHIHFGGWNSVGGKLFLGSELAFLFAVFIEPLTVAPDELLNLSFSDFFLSWSFVPCLWLTVILSPWPSCQNLNMK